MLATTSIVLVLAIFDAACACLMARSGYDKDALLAVHPGGGGEKLAGGKLRARHGGPGRHYSGM